MTERLSLSDVDLDEVVMALDDRGDWANWYLDPATGRTVLSTDETYSGIEAEVDTEGMIAIDPMPSGRAYDAMVQFANAVVDPHVREVLRRALEGKGAFRRFRHALDDWPELGLHWRDFELLTSELRALDWLGDLELVALDEVDAAIDERRRRAEAVLAELGDLGLPRFDAADVPDRWEEIAHHAETDGGVVLTRDGRPWCTITPIRPSHG